MRIYSVLILIALTACSVTTTPSTPTPSSSPTAEPTILVQPNTTVITPTPIQLTNVVTIDQFEGGKVHLLIPKINIDTPIDVAKVVVVNGESQYLEPGKNPIWIPVWSKNIGQDGLSEIYGHRQWVITRMVFDELVKLEHGDTIYVTTPTQLFTYDVVNTTIVYPSHLDEALGAKNSKALKDQVNELALVTCWPWGTTWQRFIVFAVLTGVKTK